MSENQNPSEIASYMALIYAKLCNDNKECNIDDIEQFLGTDINKIGKISNKFNSCLENYVLSTEIKQGLKAMRLSSMGGHDEISGRLHSYLGRKLPNIILGAIREIILYEKT